MKSSRLLVGLLFVVPSRRRRPTPSAAARAQPDGLAFRFLGPVVGNRVASIAGVPGDPSIYYAGAASGGVWKTTDGGIRWTPVSDSMPVAAIGALAVAPVRSERRLGRHRGGVGDPRQRRDRRRHLQVDRRRPHLDAHGARRNRPHRPHPRPPDQPRHRVRLRDRTHHRAAAGARRVPDDRRRPALGSRAVRRREHRLLRPVDGREEPAHALRGHVAGRDAPVGDAQRRPRQRHLRVARRRHDVDEGRGAPVCRGRRSARSTSPSRRPIRTASTR